MGRTMMHRGNIFRSIDWWTIVIYLVLMLFGWMNIYGASYDFDNAGMIDLSTTAGKQMMWIGVSMLVGMVLLAIDAKMYDTLAYVLYVAVVVVLLLTPFVGTEIKGSRSWIRFGSMSLQPAELAKFAIALAVAKYMSRYEYQVRNWQDLVVPFLLIGIPMGIVMVLQKETGTALVFAAFVLTFYRQGMSGNVLLWGVAAVLLFIIVIKFGVVALPWGSGDVGMLVAMLIVIGVEIYSLLNDNNNKHALILTGSIVGLYTIALVVNHWHTINFNWLSIGIAGASAMYLSMLTFINRHRQIWLVVLFSIFSIGYCQACNFVFTNVLQPHQRSRIEVLLGLKEDPQGAEYNVNQAKIAIGSGGFLGKGYLQGTQTKLSFVPEQATDFIFCTVGEEWGFAGTSVVVLLYLALILRLIYMAERQKDRFSQIYGYCVASVFFFHLTINVGMVLGLLPVIGIPLPFFSYGGSSLLGFTLLLFIFIKLDAARIDKI